MSPTTNDGGSTILGYELWMNTGTDGSSFSLVSTYTATSFTMYHTVTTLADAIVTGKVYAFKWRAYNSIGYSAFSE